MNCFLFSHKCILRTIIVQLEILKKPSCPLSFLSLKCDLKRKANADIKSIIIMFLILLAQ